MEHFQVSVLIPVFNASKYVEKAVKSALKQPETAEVILVEDGSNDNSAEVCRRIASENEFVKFYQHPDQKNHGAGPTRNYAIELANYPYISFLDADDFYLNNRFKKTKNVFKNHLEFPENFSLQFQSFRPLNYYL